MIHRPAPSFPAGTFFLFFWSLSRGAHCAAHAYYMLLYFFSFLLSTQQLDAIVLFSCQLAILLYRSAGEFSWNVYLNENWLYGMDGLVVGSLGVTERKLWR